jgi:hypothetical protein
VTSRRRPAGRHEGRHDLEIARSVIPRPIVDVARDLGIADGELKLYWPTKAKVTLEAIRRLEADRPRGKYVVVTRHRPTPLGEGKSTTSVPDETGIRGAESWHVPAGTCPRAMPPLLAAAGQPRAGDRLTDTWPIAAGLRRQLGGEGSAWITSSPYDIARRSPGWRTRYSAESHTPSIRPLTRRRSPAIRSKRQPRCSAS